MTGALIVTTGILEYQSIAAGRNYSQALSSANSNYSTLQTQSQSIISALQNQVLNTTSSYINAEYNLTHPFIEMLYKNESVNIPPATGVTYYNTTYGKQLTSYEPGEYDFSFNAPYYGYLLFNETNSGMNSTLKSAPFKMFIATVPPSDFPTVAGQKYHSFNTYLAPAIVLGPQSGKTYIIPVENGTNYVIFYNYNYNQSVTATFNMEYVGFRTS